MRSALPRALALAAACALAASAAHATTIYSYSAPINAWYDAGGRSSFALYAGLNGSPLSLWFDVAAPLANLGDPSTFVNITSQVISWQFGGGSPLLQQSKGAPGTSMNVAMITDANGQVLTAQF